MSYTDKIPYKGKGAKLIVRDKWREAEDAHTAAQNSGLPEDYDHAAALFDELDGNKAEAMANMCRRTARILREG